ncbi:MAG: hypothetical protein SFU99_15175 [Saprospiraceae bacterium]|nr:hypothetical protein [Saprospiraceae bacterium]
MKKILIWFNGILECGKFGIPGIPIFQHSITPTFHYSNKILSAFSRAGGLQGLPAFCLWAIQIPLSDPLTSSDHLTTPPNDSLTPSDHLTTPPNDSLTSSDHLTTSLNDSLTPSDHLTTSPSDSLTPSDHLTTSPNDSLTPSDHLMHASDQLNKPCANWTSSIKELKPKKWKKKMEYRR